MDDAKVGSVFRAVRIREQLTQVEVARRARIHPRHVSHIERGLGDDLPLRVVRRVGSVLGIRTELDPRWRGSDLDRLVNGAHGALQESVVSWMESLAGWIVLPEATFSIFGERGAIDILAYHAASRTLLIVELKTLLVDPAEVTRRAHQRVRLARSLAADNGWETEHVASWLILTDTRTNRRHVARFAHVLRRDSTVDGRTMRAWMRAPSGPISALSFWEMAAAVIPRRVRAKRVCGQPRPGRTEPSSLPPRVP